MALQAVSIPFFAGNQNLVFVPALLALLAATVVICLPIVFAPTLRRSKRRTPVVALVVVLAAVALVGTALAAANGFRTLGDERARVQAELRSQYGLDLDADEVGELIDGGKPLRTLPEQARAAKLKNPDRPKTLELKPTATDADRYELHIGEQPWPR